MSGPSEAFGHASGWQAQQQLQTQQQQQINKKRRASDALEQEQQPSTLQPNTNRTEAPTVVAANTFNPTQYGQTFVDEETGEESYSCDACSKLYQGKNARSVWRRHLQDKHGVPLAMQPRKTRWDSGQFFFFFPCICLSAKMLTYWWTTAAATLASRAKSEEERRRRTLESKRKWARKNRAQKRALKLGQPLPADDEESLSSPTLPPFPIEIPDHGQFLRPGSAAGQPQSATSSHSNVDTPVTAGAATPQVPPPISVSEAPVQDDPVFMYQQAGSTFAVPQHSAPSSNASPLPSPTFPPQSLPFGFPQQQFSHHLHQHHHHSPQPQHTEHFSPHLDAPPTMVRSMSAPAPSHWGNEYPQEYSPDPSAAGPAQPMRPQMMRMPASYAAPHNPYYQPEVMLYPQQQPTSQASLAPPSHMHHHQHPQQHMGHHQPQQYAPPQMQRMHSMPHPEQPPSLLAPVPVRPGSSSGLPSPQLLGDCEGLQHQQPMHSPILPEQQQQQLQQQRHAPPPNGNGYYYNGTNKIKPEEAALGLLKLRSSSPPVPEEADDGQQLIQPPKPATRARSRSRSRSAQPPAPAHMEVEQQQQQQVPLPQSLSVPVEENEDDAFPALFGNAAVPVPASKLAGSGEPIVSQAEAQPVAAKQTPLVPTAKGIAHTAALDTSPLPTTGSTPDGDAEDDTDYRPGDGSPSRPPRLGVGPSRRSHRQRDSSLLKHMSKVDISTSSSDHHHHNIADKKGKENSQNVDDDDDTLPDLSQGGFSSADSSSSSMHHLSTPSSMRSSSTAGADQPHLKTVLNPLSSLFKQHPVHDPASLHLSSPMNASLSKDLGLVPDDPPMFDLYSSPAWGSSHGYKRYAP